MHLHRYHISPSTVQEKKTRSKAAFSANQVEENEDPAKQHYGGNWVFCGSIETDSLFLYSSQCREHLCQAVLYYDACDFQNPRRH
jgi:hypothetical protein